MKGIEEIDGLVRARGFDDVGWIDPREIVVARWVRMKCVYECSHFGRNANCPPNVPPIEECEKLFGEYEKGMIFHFNRRVDTRDERVRWEKETNDRLLELERDVFISGYRKTLLFTPSICRLCADCVGSLSECRHLASSRPAPEAMGVDVFATVKKYGFPLDVLTDYDQPMNRYGLLLIE